MRGNVTLLNKLKRADSLTNLDVWYKTELQDIEYMTTVTRTATNTTVLVGESFKILLPFNHLYMPYNEWKESDERDNYYTLSAGDYIFFGTVNEEITPNTLQKVKQKYEPFVCEVRSIVEVAKRFGARYQFSIEGV